LRRIGRAASRGRPIEWRLGPNGREDPRKMTDLRHEILGLEGPLLTYATQVCESADEAKDLVQLTLRAALEGGARPPAGRDTKLWLFGLMRNAFHSVARRQATSRERGAAGQQWRADRAEAIILTARAGLT
jgi:DNA-directed RNA polymerase specialized sigma24 family protein